MSIRSMLAILVLLPVMVACTNGTGSSTSPSGTSDPGSESPTATPATSGPAGCASFAADPVDTQMGSSFTRDGYEFTSIDTSFLPRTIDLGGGTIALEFGDGGLEIALPGVSGSVDLEAVARATPITVDGLDGGGAVVATVTLPQQSALAHYQLVAAAITKVRLTGGQNEGLLASICADVRP
jgi:hypothetical protein